MWSSRSEIQVLWESEGFSIRASYPQAIDVSIVSDSNTGLIRVCLRCQSRFYICVGCFRNHGYCTVSCRELARKDSIRSAGRRYAATKAGREATRLRQIRFRRLRNTVTHQSIPASPLVRVGNVKGASCAYKNRSISSLQVLPKCSCCQTHLQWFDIDYQSNSYRKWSQKYAGYR